MRLPGDLTFGAGGAIERTCVVTVTLLDAGSVPSGVTDFGETEQVEFVGTPLQLRTTVSLNPAEGVTASAKVTELPATTVTEGGEVDSVNVLPVPPTRLTV